MSTDKIMSENGQKKRKRSLKDATETALPKPKKTRVIEDAEDTHDTETKKLGKDGNSRQEKSERRAKKAKKSTGQTVEYGDQSATAFADKFIDAATTEKLNKDGKSRQEKSERRAKKAKKEKERCAKGSRSDAAAANVGNDTLATGEDFVSLKEPLSIAKPSTKQVKTSKSSKVSPKVDQSAPVTETGDSSSKGKPARFIVFVGNLPYTATTEQILAHFSKIIPSSIRHSTDKATKRSKGFAFLEFDGYDKMKTALKLYHHSIFDPDRKVENDDEKDTEKSKPSTKSRRINVELTVGGGGKGKERKEKLKGKNQRLEEQRERARVKEKEGKDKEERKKSGKGTDANATVVKHHAATEEIDHRGAIHPSRLNRVAR